MPAYHLQLVPHHKSLQGVPSDRALVPVALASEQRALRQREEAEAAEEVAEEREARRHERAMVTRREAKHVAHAEAEEAGRTSPGAKAVDFGGARRPRRLAPRDGFGGRGRSSGGGSGGGGGRGRGERDEPPEPASQSSEEGSMSDPEWGDHDHGGGSSAEGEEQELSDEVSEVSGDSVGRLAYGGGSGTRRTLRSAGPGAVAREARGRRERRRQRRHEQELHATRRSNRPARGVTARARYDEGDDEYGWIDHYDGPSGRHAAQLAAQERRRSEGGTGGTGSMRLLRHHAREGRRGGSTSASVSAPPPLTGGEAAAAEVEAEAEAAEAAEWEEVASRGAEWLLRTEPPSAPSEFVPMVGDEMVYLRRRSAVKTPPWLCPASAAPASPEGRTSRLLAAQHSQRPGESGPFGAAPLPRGLGLVSMKAAY